MENTTLEKIEKDTNRNTNNNSGAHYGRVKNKWVAFFLCLFIGWIVDCVILLLKPNPYSV